MTNPIATKVREVMGQVRATPETADLLAYLPELLRSYEELDSLVQYANDRIGRLEAQRTELQDLTTRCGLEKNTLKTAYNNVVGIRDQLARDVHAAIEENARIRNGIRELINQHSMAMFWPEQLLAILDGRESKSGLQQIAERVHQATD